MRNILYSRSAYITTKTMDDLLKPLQALSLNDVEVTGKEIGRGAYGVVLEVKVSGLSCAGKKLHDAIAEVICHFNDCHFHVFFLGISCQAVY